MGKVSLLSLIHISIRQTRVVRRSARKWDETTARRQCTSQGSQPGCMESKANVGERACRARAWR
ncbi:hypothetical protein BD310DRAFT_832647 [Dichomitus squalens]|uniref:Uncharacterized protein n=1 Tax=Dichomitus squalens TaxID=114155 RepID=A0A4V2K6H8_9APHY|nr:hypothetical protein BD310DRAFT_832647 [Dichomitus squalens]